MTAEAQHIAYSQIAAHISFNGDQRPYVLQLTEDQMPRSAQEILSSEVKENNLLTLPAFEITNTVNFPADLAQNIQKLNEFVNGKNIKGEVNVAYLEFPDNTQKAIPYIEIESDVDTRESDDIPPRYPAIVVSTGEGMTVFENGFGVGEFVFLPVGDEVIVAIKYKDENGDPQYIALEIEGENVAAYVQLDASTVVEAETIEPNFTQAQVKADNTNVRSGPSTNTARIRSTDTQETLLVIGEENGWTNIILETGEIGWIRSDLLNEVSSQPGPTPAPEAPMEVITARQQEFFESLGLARFSEQPQIANSDGSVQIFYSEGYFSSESPIENFYATPQSADRAISFILDSAFEAVNTDPANSRIVDKPYIQVGSEVMLSSYIQQSSRNPGDHTAIRGQLNAVRQHVVSYEEYEKIVSLFRTDTKETQEILAKVGLSKNSLPEHVGLYASRGNSSFALGIAYFTEDGTLVIINHPIRLREKSRDFNYANIFSDGPGALLTTLSRSLNIPQGQEVGLTRKSKANADELYAIFGCYSENGWCNTPPATIQPILN